MKQFFSSVMKMEPREIDASLHVRKMRRPHTVIVYLSDVVFKRFIYSARKKFRQENETSETSTPDLFVSHNLTIFNYKLNKDLKLEGNLFSSI